ncbi:MAG: hypothetical protein M3Y91_14395 [Actinomycetota bacterium]|nr:hypothetical protein [Actinomycetota bacterium]
MSLALILGAGGYLVVAALRDGGAGSPAWPLALAVSAVVLLVGRVVDIGSHLFLGESLPAVVIDSFYAEAAALLAAGLALGSLGVRSLRRFCSGG